MKQINSKHLFAKAMGEEVPELSETDVQAADEPIKDTKGAPKATSAVVESPQEEKPRQTEEAVTAEQVPPKNF